ncbi:putative F-box family protein [Hibiscus syriacus]|uniref:F-box family protein n=1 Tax=Hibiscus syriacus TaxID=106335 RepID=A0A6A3BE06_HIBSY|nr:putative F-box family protein [Hibiscus syriacus]
MRKQEQLLQGDEDFHDVQLGLSSFEFSNVPLKHYSKGPFFHYINDSDVKILQSCNGLLLCESYRRCFLICDPTTKAFRKIYCPSNSCYNLLSRFCVSLAFDPLRSPDYKIICIWESYKEPCKFNLDLYSSKTGSWDLSIISFEIDEDEPVDLTMGFSVEAPEECRYFGESRGVLYLTVTYCMPVCLEFDIFEMGRDYSEWIWKKRVNVGDAVKVFPELELGCVEYGPGFSGVCIIGWEEEEEPMVVVWADGKIVCFDNCLRSGARYQNWVAVSWRR